MTRPATIEMTDVALRFRRRSSRTPQLKQAIVNLWHGRRLDRGTDFLLFDKFNLSIRNGERIGIIGRNGSGKTTLLKMLAGVYRPTKGRIRISGRVSPVIELGAGFNLELTGVENILLNGAFLGFSRSQMRAKIPRIIEFSELESSAEVPLKYYSSGMLLRLAFSIATDMDPEILLVDEIFAAGDAGFVIRAHQRMNALFDASKIALFVSHSMAFIESLCDRTLWLENGRILMDGNSRDVCAAYTEVMTSGAVAAAEHAAMQPVR